MDEASKRRIGLAVGFVALLAVMAGAFLVPRLVRRGGAHDDGLPRPDSEAYRDTVSAFFAGVAALDVDANDQARKTLDRAAQLAPGEPAIWADRGLLHLRLGDFEAAASDLEHARALAPESGAVEQLLALLEGRRGQFAQATAHLRRAVELDPDDLKARFALARETERQGGADGEAEAERQMGEILRRQPENLPVLLERARLAAKRGDAPAFRATLTPLGRLAPSWPRGAQERFHALEQDSADLRQSAVRLLPLKNMLVRFPPFRQGLDAVELPVGVVGEPIERFLKLTAPTPTSAAPDEALVFTVAPVPGAPAGRWDLLLAVSLTGEGPPALFVVNGRELRRADGSGGALPFPGGPAATPPGPAGVLAVDWNNDYRMDFVLAGAGGLRLFQQKADGTFDDVTKGAGLEAQLVSAPASGAWAADVEMDGDVDIVVGIRDDAPIVLRNNSDGTFGVSHPFEGATALGAFAWADLDRDGDPDAALLDGRGTLRIYANERAGRFTARPGPEKPDTFHALAVADVDGDGTVALLALRPGGTVVEVAFKDGAREWDGTEITRQPRELEGMDRLLVGDLDNNGSADLIASGPSRGWFGLGGGPNRFRAQAVPAGLRVAAVADVDGDGRLKLAGLSPEGQPVLGTSRGAKQYHWQVIRPRGARAFGDGRINSFGVGGEVEVRAGLLVQKQVIAGPILHFGLGDHPASDVARIVWPNGTVQGEFSAQADHEIVAEQRLKGSCPFLFAFDGTSVQFVTDFIWRSPLGLRINAQDTAGVSQTEDWVKIGGSQLAPRAGYYDVRITAELWETHYWDHVALMVVDHPTDTEVFVDERFARQPPPLAVQSTGPLYPIAYARDDQGRDVTEVVRARDGRYLDGFGRGAYQGVTRDHWVEVELGEDVPRDRPLRLVAHGWIHPTDSSVNVALGQGRHDAPRGLVLEVPDEHGGWTVARDDLGFPAGKNKTVLVDLDGVFRPGAPRTCRLRTNLEVFWDELAVVAAAPTTLLKTQRLAPDSAELRPRGYSRLTRANESAPELPQYALLDGTRQRWLDLVGYYTRFGDVRTLLNEVDDRYVIANAGDELALRFRAPAPPPEGWARDFVLIGDGWNKDGDYNTAFSRTVLPLPSHQRPRYDTPPGALEDDPVYRFHPDDWREYHTRYITPDDFQGALRPRAGNPRRRGSESNR